jgi:hypothetical protein
MLKKGTKVSFHIADVDKEINWKICGIRYSESPVLGFGYIVELEEYIPDYNYKCIMIYDLFIRSIEGVKYNYRP